MQQELDKVENMPKEEIDEPLNCSKDMEMETPQLTKTKQAPQQTPQLTDALLRQNKLDKSLFNTIKGHHLPGWCVFGIFVMYILEKFFKTGNSENVKTTIEIFKVLMFSLSGYLYGRNQA